MGNNISASLMLTGFLVAVLCNFVSLSMFHLLPLWLYLIFPFFSVLTTPIILRNIGNGVVVYGSSLEYIRCLSLRWGPRGKYYRKRLKGVQPIKWAVAVGDFNIISPIDTRTKTSYFYAILSYTITACLSIGS